MKCKIKLHTVYIHWLSGLSVTYCDRYDRLFWAFDILSQVAYFGLVFIDLVACLSRKIWQHYLQYYMLDTCMQV